MWFFFFSFSNYVISHLTKRKKKEKIINGFNSLLFGKGKIIILVKNLWEKNYDNKHDFIIFFILSFFFSVELWEGLLERKKIFLCHMSQLSNEIIILFLLNKEKFTLLTVFPFFFSYWEKSHSLKKILYPYFVKIRNDKFFFNFSKFYITLVNSIKIWLSY